MSKKKLVFSVFFTIAIISIIFYFTLSNGLPGNISIIKDNEETIEIYLPFTVYIHGQKGSNIKINGKTIDDKFYKIGPEDSITVRGNEIGSSFLNIKLFGFLPLRTLKVNILPEVEVYPGGHAIGVLMRSKGVMVVGNSYVRTKSGEKIYPAKEAGISVGDVILRINGQKINDKVNLASEIQKYARQEEDLSFIVKKRKGYIDQVNVKPVKNEKGKYMIGLYVDDGVAGVGTLTFYNPETRQYGALGHTITESNSQIKIDVRKGQIVEAQISGINYGRKGVPGEKQGTFFNVESVLGNITKNTRFGIFGTLERIPENPFFSEKIPVATVSQVERGPAKVYTVVQEGEIEEFDINIDRIYHQSSPQDKGMIISITDNKLKEFTGGIIQGMSGSPIVQNGRLVGAVTHVFINNPTRGYGVFAEWMLRETIDHRENDQKKKAS